MDAQKKQLKVYLIVLIYNGKKWIDSCFQSLYKSNYGNFVVLAIDNNSTDDSSEYIQKNYPEVEIIRNTKNVGTARGNNMGITHALKNGADYVVLLNQDIIVTENWLSEMVKIAEENPEIGALSPIQWEYEGNEIDPGFREMMEKTDYFNDLKTGRLKDKYFTDNVIAASMLVKSKAIQEIGILDPLYFMYFEDNDFCRRLVYKGYKIAFTTGSKVFHNHSAKHRSKLPMEVVYRLKRNYLLLMLKDPNHSFIYNLKNVFLWTKWDQYFKECERKLALKTKIFIFFVVNLSRIYRTYLIEKEK